MKNLAYLLVGLWTTHAAAYAQYSEIQGLSAEFVKDYAEAQRQVAADNSAEPLITLIGKYSSYGERAELNLSIGLLYGQTSGLVSPEKAIPYFTKALGYDLPEVIRVKTILWRGNAHEQIQRHESALADYIRGLLVTTFYSLEEPWPEILDPEVTLYTNRSSDGELQKHSDYKEYRMRVDTRRRLMMSRYYLIDAAKRILGRAEFKDFDLSRLFFEISPEPGKLIEIKRLLDSENKRPWP